MTRLFNLFHAQGLGTQQSFQFPSARRASSAANQSLFDNSFAFQGPQLWNAMPDHLNFIQYLEYFKDTLTKFMLSLPDKPPIRGYSPTNSNSAVLAERSRRFLLLGLSGDLMALSRSFLLLGLSGDLMVLSRSFLLLGFSGDLMGLSIPDETQHRSHRLVTSSGLGRN